MNIVLPDGGKIHMIGICGSGMSGLAVIMSSMGYRVAGSDLKMSVDVERMEGLGISIHKGHDASYVGDADIVVKSAAIPSDNPEILKAFELGIPVITRAELLGKLMSLKKGIAVSGTHGKTSTTSMLAMVMERAGLDPTVYIGGNLSQLGGSAKTGDGEYFVAEACEAFNSFLEIYPYIAVVTNIEADHLDCHGSLDGVIDSFRKFLTHLDDHGFAVLCADCANVQKILPEVAKNHRVITYGFNDDVDCRACDVNSDIPEPVFNVCFKGENIGTFKLNVPGEHNISNALAVIAVSMELGIKPDVICEALFDFHGADRRFEILGTANGVTVIDDYAHHPTEVHATLAAAKTLNRRIVALFQPHLFSRTMLFADQFAESLKLADLLYLAGIFPSREKPIPGITSQIIANKMGDSKTIVRHLPNKETIADEILPSLKNGDLVLVMGAGDIRSAGELLLEKLKSLDKGLM
ncbi:MAG: UDP-N-acetylmuramate--L-alanine ligase [Armatimonadota bacterium]